MGLPLPLFQIAGFLRRYRCRGPGIRYETIREAALPALAIGAGQRAGVRRTPAHKGDETLQTLDSKNATVDSGDVALDSKNVGDISGRIAEPCRGGQRTRQERIQAENPGEKDQRIPEIKQEG